VILRIVCMQPTSTSPHHHPYLPPLLPCPHHYYMTPEVLPSRLTMLYKVVLFNKNWQTKKKIPNKEDKSWMFVQTQASHSKNCAQPSKSSDVMSATRDQGRPHCSLHLTAQFLRHPRHSPLNLRVQPSILIAHPTWQASHTFPQLLKIPCSTRRTLIPCQKDLWTNQYRE